MSKNLTGLSFEELIDNINDMGGKKYIAKQIWNWIYKKNIIDIDLMSDISIKFRELLKEKFNIGLYRLKEKKISSDGTEKFLLELQDGNSIESVLIPEKDRLTICISSQVGCKFNCSFCSTGKMGFIRDLTTAEIVEEILYIQKLKQKNITNVVFMGMGEPFDNFDNVIKSAKIINDDNGLAIGSRKITISTFGHIPGIRNYIDLDIRFRLAISLHNPFNDQRSEIMPGNRQYNLEDLFKILREYTKVSNRKVVFEYILLNGVNDSQDHAKELKTLLSKLPSKLNLIKYHSNPYTEFSPTTNMQQQKFYNFFQNVNFPVVFRASRGEDIDAACGQLYINNN
ncbi:MAG: 23S rRNA (adenine(2503)-C(2))-methyltransferase RlmN [Candidatus Delongbacteria bacterium]|nr:23S rRNA (adenine(2503)-C(2))-methyltransferase RlmN [Candidatus Delongbacteria bacterium]